MSKSPISDRWRIDPGDVPDLAAIDPGTTAGAPGDKEATKAATDTLRARLAELQARLYAESTRSLLIIFQAMDAGGKDGTVRAVFHGVNPQGVRVVSFKEPTEEELAHDFLWRIHAEAPADGWIAVFNRSQYEDVLIARVHELVPPRVWRARYSRIKAFEALLHAEDTTIVKVMLHISRDEQRRRLQERVDDPAKRWKFNPGDLAEREHWDAYQSAYTDAIAKTSTTEAPWYVVPGDRNWYRNWAVLNVLVDTLEGMDPQFPSAPEGLDGITVV